MICLTGVAAASDVVELILPPEAEVAADQIVLGRISEIQGGPQDLRELVASVVLGASPRPGRTAWIHQGHVQSGLDAKGIPSGMVHITAQGPTKILRSYDDLTSRKICAAVKNFIYQSAPWDRSQIKIRSVTCDQDLRLPPGNLDLRVIPPKHTDWIGAIPFRVQVYVNHRLAHSVSVPAHVEVWSNVIVSAKPLGRRQPIGPDDIKVQRMNLARIPRNAILSEDQVIGRRTTRPVAMNTILSSDRVEIPPLIRKGDVVQLVAESPSLKVVTRGMAKEKGGLGDRIRVENLSSKKSVYARIVDASTVRVEL